MLEQTRAELQDNLNSARDELGASIACNHDELVALERKGEQNYYEFEFTRSKDFVHSGPLSLSLRKTDMKKRTDDLVVFVEDSSLAKKHISLYERVLFYPGDSKQPIELVVNRIEKNRVYGYVSEPKYKPSEVATTASGVAAATNASKPAPDVSLPHRPGPPQ